MNYVYIICEREKISQSIQKVIVTLIFYSTASSCVYLCIIIIVTINLQDKVQSVEFVFDIFTYQVLGETSRVSFTGDVQRVYLCF
jgi:hypothetical protein